MVIVAVAIIASVLGALVPAIRAAQMNPVEALRWE
jgi:ABC-type antimicrobial peptide transport system permease subunit